MIDEGDAAVGALADLAAIPADDESGQPAPVEKQDSLLPALESGRHCLVKGLTDGTEASSLELRAHVDDGHGWERTTHDPVRQFQEPVISGQRPGIGGDTGGRAPEHQHSLYLAGQLTRNRRCVVARHPILLEGGSLLLVDDDQPEPR